MQEDIISLRNIRIPRSVVVPVDVDHTVHSPVEDLVMHWSGDRRSPRLIERIPSIGDMNAHTDMRRVVTEHSLK